MKIPLHRHAGLLGEAIHQCRAGDGKLRGKAVGRQRQHIVGIDVADAGGNGVCNRLHIRLVASGQYAQNSCHQMSRHGKGRIEGCGVFLHQQGHQLCHSIFFLPRQTDAKAGILLCQSELIEKFMGRGGDKAGGEQLLPKGQGVVAQILARGLGVMHISRRHDEAVARLQHHLLMEHPACFYI